MRLFTALTLSNIFFLIFGNISFASILTTGNFRPAFDERACDIHIEANEQGTKLYVSYIGNQRTRVECGSSGVIQVFNCSESGSCLLDGSSADANTLDVINAKSVYTRWNKVKWDYVNNSAVLLPNKFESTLEYGYISQSARTFTGSSRCAFFDRNNTYVYCDDTSYAQQAFCPKAMTGAESAALSNCEKQTGKECFRKSSDHSIKNLIPIGVYNSSNQIYQFFGATLSCEATVSVSPRD